MKTRLPDDKIFSGFELKNLKDFKSSDFLEGETPEEVVMGILANFENQDAGQVIERTLIRLKELTNDGSMLGKYAEQLMVLSELRKLGKETEQKIRKMAIIIDIENNTFYKEGKQEGKQEEKLTIAKQLLSLGDSVAKISKVTGLSISVVEKLKEK